jgi:heme exporter protein D
MAKRPSSSAEIDTAPTPPPANGGNRGPYVDLDTLKSADGIIGIISQRRSTGVLTFAVFKEFERDGILEKSSFVPENMGASYLAMVHLVLDRIAELKTTLPQVQQQVRGARR